MSNAKLAATGELPGIQSILEWALGAEVSAALAAAEVIHRCVAKGVAKQEVGEFIACCESPAERQFVLGFFLVDSINYAFRAMRNVLEFERDGETIQVTAQQEMTDIEWECDCDDAATDDGCEHTAPTFARLDFLLRMWVGDESSGCVQIAVEIDGHEFHEKTKEQARADKSRDRRVLAEPGAEIGAVLRYTGSEVFEDPAQCVLEAVGILRMRAANLAWLGKRHHESGFARGYAQRGAALAIVPVAEAAE